MPSTSSLVLRRLRARSIGSPGLTVTARIVNVSLRLGMWKQVTQDSLLGQAFITINFIFFLDCMTKNGNGRFFAPECVLRLK